MDQERLYKNDNKVNYPDQNKGCSGNKNPEESLSLDKKGEESMAYSELVKNFNHIHEYIVNFMCMVLKAVMSIQEKAHVLMMMNAAVWRAGWEII